MDNGFNVNKCGMPGVADRTAYLRHMEWRMVRMVGETGVLGRWMETLFPTEQVVYVWALYRVGALPDERTTFFYVTREEYTVDAKVMAYGPDGHRVKDDNRLSDLQTYRLSDLQTYRLSDLQTYRLSDKSIDCQTADSQTADNTPASGPKTGHSSASLDSLKVCQSKKDSLKVCQSQEKSPKYMSVTWLHALDRLERPLALPLFGEHLADTLPFAPLCLVESEKTALIAKLWRPDCTWLATGGKSCFTAERLHVLSGRTVLVWPDADAIGEWMERAATLGPALDISFRFPATYLNHIRHGPPKGDLADLIVATKTTQGNPCAQHE